MSAGPGKPAIKKSESNKKIRTDKWDARRLMRQHGQPGDDMEAAINFSEWTDAQLETGLRFHRDPNFEALQDEVNRRVQAGIWKTDGSHERIDALVRSSRHAPRRPR